jgi:hypothetical protein
VVVEVKFYDIRNSKALLNISPAKARSFIKQNVSKKTTMKIGSAGTAVGRERDFGYRNVYAVISFVLGFLAGLYGILIGLDYYYAGWPAHGPVGVLGALLVIFGLLTISGSFLVLSRRGRIAGAILILIFGLLTSIQGIFDIMELLIRLLLPILSFTCALYAAKWDRNKV